MELDVNDLLARYSRALADSEHRRILAEARADAVEAQLRELQESKEQGDV